MATVVGIHFSLNAQGKQVSTLHIVEPFEAYYSAEDKSRGCYGKKVSTVYVGDYDCSGIKVGSEIEIYYGKAITTKNGTFQTIKQIDIISSK